MGRVASYAEGDVDEGTLREIDMRFFCAVSLSLGEMLAATVNRS